MNRSSIELSVGVFVVLGIAAIVWLAVQASTGAGIGGSTYEVNARFTNIGGLKPGSPVLIAGVTVGRVEKINLDSQYAAIVRLNVKKDVHLPADTIASIKTSGLIGDKYIALSPGAESNELPPGGTISDTESAVDLESLISRFAFGSVSSSPTPSSPPPSAPK